MTWRVRHRPLSRRHTPAATEDNPLPPRRDNLHATAQTTGIAIMPRRFGRVAVALRIWWVFTLLAGRFWLIVGGPGALCWRQCLSAWAGKA